MKLWLDDDTLCRTPPEGKFDIWCFDAETAMALVRYGLVSFISFDHDLGPGPSGYDVACFIERLAAGGDKPPDWEIHSGNMVGANNIQRAMVAAHELYEKARTK